MFLNTTSSFAWLMYGSRWGKAARTSAFTSDTFILGVTWIVVCPTTTRSLRTSSGKPFVGVASRLAGFAVCTALAETVTTFLAHGGAL